MTKNFDVIVIGAGPGGYIAAIRAAQLGLSTACIDAWSTADGAPALGGACTNVGCIPSKALLQSSEYYEQAGHHFAAHGIGIDGLKLDLAQMLERKDKIVKQNNDGITYLFKKNKVTFFHGHGAFVGGGAEGYRIRITGSDATEEQIQGRQVVLATGSAPRALPDLPFDEETILSNTGALAMTTVPAKLGVIGAGVIGLEMGSVWSRLGSQVTLLEASTEFLAMADKEIAKEAHKLFIKQGLAIEMGVQVQGISKTESGVDVSWQDATGVAHTDSFDKLVVSIGRVPHTSGLNIEEIGLRLDERGFIEVDESCKTNLKNVWAIGDVVRGPMLAHKSEEEGVAVAERIAGQHGHVDYAIIPSVIYTTPEIAWVGRSEEALKKDGVAYRKGSFPFLANGRARALGDTDGLVKFLADARTDEILGVHIIGPSASELISEAVTAMAFRASSEDIARICHAHPTLSETLKEAALAVDKRSLNY